MGYFTRSRAVITDATHALTADEADVAALADLATLATLATTATTANNALAVAGTNVDVFPYLDITAAPYNCDPTDTVDCSTGFQAALDDAVSTGQTVYIPRGSYRFTSGVVCTSVGDTGTAAFVSIMGAGTNLSRLIWRGASNGTLLEFATNKDFKFSGVLILNQTGSHGTTCGCLMTGPLNIGTQTTATLFEQIHISQFDVNLKVGVLTHSGCASECEFNHCSFTGGGHGVLIQGDSNTLNLQFLELGISSNEIGLESSAGGSVTVLSGTASNNTVTDFKASVNGLPFSVRNFRSENTEQFLITPNDGVQNGLLILDDCRVSLAVENVQVDVGRTCHLWITNCEIDGYVKLPKPGSSLMLKNNRLWGDTTTRLPFLIDDSGTDFDKATGWVYCENNWNVADGGSGFATFKCKDCNGPLNNWVYTPIRDTVYGTIYNSPQERYKRCRMISEGTLTDGNNLRMQAIFDGTGSCEVEFVRDIANCTVAGQNPLITVPSGELRKSDLGKRVVLLAAGSGGSDLTSFIEQMVSDTQFRIPDLASGLPNIDSSAVTIRIGEEEPDEEYMITYGHNGFDERINWIDNTKGTGGFWLESNNPASEATVDIWLMR